MRNKNQDEYWIFQNYLISKLITIFGEEFKKVRQINTPGTPRGVQKIINNDNEKLSAEEHKKFRSGIGSLIYLLKHSRPELSNTIRELSRYLSGPSEKNKKKLIRILKWVIDNPDIGLRIKPKIEFNEKGEII